MSKDSPTFVAADLPPDARVAIVAARFNATIVDELLAGCVARLAELGVKEPRVAVHRVPGAFELPVAAKVLADAKKWDAIICLGCVIKGDTPHFDFVAGQSASGSQQVAVATGIPVIFGVLTTHTVEQARDRAGGAHSHAGRNAAEVALEMIAVIDRIRRG